MKYFEDFHEGQAIVLGTKTFTKEEIIRFATEFDPQPFHLDEEAAQRSIFQGLAASGWHTAAAYMRLFVDGILNQSTSQGSPGVENLQWLKPVRPGDTLRAVYTILETRISEKRPSLGLVKGVAEMFNQHDELVMRFSGAGFFLRKEVV